MRLAGEIRQSPAALKTCGRSGTCSTGRSWSCASSPTCFTRPASPMTVSAPPCGLHRRVRGRTGLQARPAGGRRRRRSAGDPTLDPAGGAGGARQRPSARRGIPGACRRKARQGSSGRPNPRRWPGHDGGRRRRRSSPNGRRHPGHARAPAAVRRRPEDQDRIHRDVAAGVCALAGAFERCRASVAAADRAKVCQAHG